MIKKTISLILTLVLALGLCAPVFAQSEQPAAPAEYDGCPFVLVRGMEFGGLTYKAGTPEEQNCLGQISAGDIIKTIFKGIGAGIIHWNIDYFTDTVVEYVTEIMGLMACDEKGNSKYDVSVNSYPLSVANYPELKGLSDVNEEGIIKAAVDRYGAENVYYYRYDWRLDPYIHADGINALINQALADSGKDKVNLVCCSMGGIETLSYIDKYGADKLNRVIFLSSTFCGTHVTTDVLRGMIEIDPYILYMYAKQNLASGNKALGFLFDALYKSRIMGGLCNLVNNKLVPKLKDRAYSEFLKPVFGTMPSVWALVLPEGYDEAIEYMFGGEEEKYADFIALTQEYQALAERRESVLKGAEESGVSVCVIASYNCACIPVYTGGGGNGDNTLESDRVLGCAKVAPLGETLGDGYVPEDPARVSPDKVVDLSPALFPETTWAICGMPHVSCSYGTELSDFLFWAVDYNRKLTADCDPEHPQFMISSYDQDLKLWQ
ncbi:MAG: hypothetical protein IJM02_04235 [Clostridia bacterium]|nr:hypothetical protein [Clostridia bacterium]